MKGSAALEKDTGAGDSRRGFQPGDWSSSINVRDFTRLDGERSPALNAGLSDRPVRGEALRAYSDRYAARFFSSALGFAFERPVAIFVW